MKKLFSLVGGIIVLTFSCTKTTSTCKNCQMMTGNQPMGLEYTFCDDTLAEAEATWVESTGTGWKCQ
jgi:hypothetical protein